MFTRSRLIGWFLEICAYQGYFRIPINENDREFVMFEVH